MLLSVIVPAHNAEKTLPRALDSFLSSAKEGRDEILIVLDGVNQDESEAVLQEYCRKTPMVRYLYPHQQNGALGARTLGISSAKGDYVTFLDADDYFAANAMDEFAAKIEESKADILSFSFFISTAKKDSKNIFTKSARLLDKKQGFEALLNDSFIRGFTPTKIMSRSILQQGLPGSIVGPDIIFEDTFSNAVYFSRAESIYYWPAPLYHYVKAEGPTAVSRPRTNRASYHIAAFASIRLYLERFTDGALLPCFYASKFRSYLSLIYDLSQDKKHGLSKEECKRRKKEFHAVFDSKRPLEIKGTSYEEHVSPSLSKNP